MSDGYDALIESIAEIGRLEAIEYLLDWDQQTYMPPNGVDFRAKTIAMIAALKHERQIDPVIGDVLSQVTENGDPIRATNIRETHRFYDRAVKVPTKLVKEIAHTSSLARSAWVKARQDSDFATFVPHLSKLLDLRRQQAECIGYEDEIYDALLDEYEPGARTAEVAAIFADLRKQLVPLVRAIADAPTRPDSSILRRNYPRAAQERMARRFATEMGFNFESGRLDVSVHPFCTSIGAQDVRITTRYHENFLPTAVFGVMHEAGHGLYEQGFLPEHAFTPAGRFVSLGIHESQSRMWENQVGRSRPFWERHFGWAQELFPESLGDVSLDAFYGAINTVAPSLIRVEADEVTYNLHIVVRFELERDLLSGKLEVTDIPDAWNARMADLVGVRPPNDREGCLQDVHWSMGVFGYFPTYALGNLYAAQFFAAARRDIPDLDDRIRNGDLKALLEWLRANIHRQGMRYRANELCEEVTGQPLSIKPFMDYVKGKFEPIYGLA